MLIGLALSSFVIETDKDCVRWTVIDIIYVRLRDIEIFVANMKIELKSNFLARVRTRAQK